MHVAKSLSSISSRSKRREIGKTGNNPRVGVINRFISAESTDEFNEGRGDGPGLRLAIGFEFAQSATFEASELVHTDVILSTKNLVIVKISTINIKRQGEVARAHFMQVSILRDSGGHRENNLEVVSAVRNKDGDLRANDGVKSNMVSHCQEKRHVWGDRGGSFSLLLFCEVVTDVFIVVNSVGGNGFGLL
jgi:hypothetical protein